MKHTPILYSEVHGNGPLVVLLHGFLSSSRYWRKVRELVDQNYRVIAMDLLGFGNSPKPHRGTYDYEEHIAAINSTLRHHNVSAKFTIVGHSMGSLIALRYANLYPHRVRKLVLVNVPAMLDVEELRREFILGSRINQWGLGKYRTGITWTVMKLLYRLRWLPQQRREYLRQNKDFFRHTAASRLRSFYNIIGKNYLRTDLKDVSVPTVLLSGRDDKPVYLKNLSDKLQLGPHVVHHIIPTGHRIPYFMPQRIVDEIY